MSDTGKPIRATIQRHLTSLQSRCLEMLAVGLAMLPMYRGSDHVSPLVPIFALICLGRLHGILQKRVLELLPDADGLQVRTDPRIERFAATSIDASLVVPDGRVSLSIGHKLFSIAVAPEDLKQVRNLLGLTLTQRKLRVSLSPAWQEDRWLQPMLLLYVALLHVQIMFLLKIPFSLLLPAIMALRLVGASLFRAPYLELGTDGFYVGVAFQRGFYAYRDVAYISVKGPRSVMVALKNGAAITFVAHAPEAVKSLVEEAMTPRNVEDTLNLPSREGLGIEDWKHSLLGQDY